MVQTTPYGDFYQLAGGASEDGITSTDSAQFTLCFWIKDPLGGYSNPSSIMSGGQPATVNAFNVQVAGGSPGVNTVIQITTGSTFFTFPANEFVNGQWHSYCISAKNVAGTWSCTAAKDGVNVTVTNGGASGGSGNSVDLSTASITVGKNHGAGNLVKKYIAQFYLDRTTFTDFTVATNIQKFCQAGSPPQAVPLNGDGSAPTGSSPIIFSDFAIITKNFGTAGDWTNSGGATAVSSGGPQIWAGTNVANISLPLLQISSAAYGPSGAFMTLPLLQVAGVGQTPITFSGAFSLPLLQAVGLVLTTGGGSGVPVGNPLTGSIKLPLLSVLGQLLAGQTATANINLPLLQISAHDGDTAFFSLPLLQVSGSAAAGATLTGSIRLPLLQASMTWDQSGQLGASFYLPLLRLSGTMLGGAVATGSMTLPLLHLLAQGISGTVATASFSLPLLQLFAQAYSRTGEFGTITLPMIQVVAAGLRTPNQNFRGWALNAEKQYLTEYVNLKITGVAAIGNTVYVCTSAGIFTLDPNAQNDAGVAISAYAETGLSDFDDSRFKRVPRAYVSAKMSDQMQFHVLTKMTGRHAYVLPFNGNPDLFQRRVVIGRGVRDKYIGHAFQNVNGGDFRISKTTLLPVIDPRRVY